MKGVKATSELSSSQAPELTEIPFSDRLLAARSPEEVAACLAKAFASGASDEELSQAFTRRGMALANEASPMRMFALSPIHVGAFHPESDIQASWLASPVTLQDPTLFTDEYLISAIRYHCTPEMSPELIKAELMNIGFTTQALYFESFRPRESNHGEREDFLAGAQGPINISAMRGAEFAKCAERAPIYANVMAALGYNLLTLVSNCNIKDGEPGGHVFNVRRRENQFIVIDPTNPVVWRFNDGDRLYSTACYPVGDEQMNDFISGKEVPFTHSDMKQGADGKFQPGPECRRTYKLPKPVEKSEILKAFFS
jgi:hypothetical protein